jgi:hypothetical protein
MNKRNAKFRMYSFLKKEMFQHNILEAKAYEENTTRVSCVSFIDCFDVQRMRECTHG